MQERFNLFKKMSFAQSLQILCLLVVGGFSSAAFAGSDVCDPRLSLAGISCQGTPIGRSFKLYNQTYSRGKPILYIMRTDNIGEMVNNLDYRGYSGVGQCIRYLDFDTFEALPSFVGNALPVTRQFTRRQVTQVAINSAEANNAQFYTACDRAGGIPYYANINVGSFLGLRDQGGDSAPCVVCRELPAPQRMDTGSTQEEEIVVTAIRCTPPEVLNRSRTGCYTPRARTDEPLAEPTLTTETVSGVGGDTPCAQIGNPPGCNNEAAQSFIQTYCGGQPTGCSFAAQCSERKASGHAQQIASGVNCNAISIEQFQAEVDQGQLERQAANQAIQNASRQCTPDHRVAERCCLDPMSCLSGESGDSQANTQTMAAAILSQMGGADLSSTCSSQGNMANVSAAVNAYTQRQCSERRHTCTQSCLESGQALQVAAQNCAPPSGACSNEQVANLTEAMRGTTEYRDDCNTGRLRDAANMMSAQSMSNIGSAIQAQACGNEATMQSADAGSYAPANTSGGFTVPNITSGGLTVPVGNSANAGLNGLNADGTANLNSADRSNLTPSGNTPSSLENALAAAKSESVPQGSTGFTPAASSGGSAASSAGGGGGSRSPSSYGRGGGSAGSSGGYNTQVGSLDAGGGEGGGSSGGGYSSRRRGGSNFLEDLKKFLPGNSAAKPLSQQVNGLAVVTRPNAALGHVHEDIFTKMTRAFAKQCVQSSLLDCQVVTVRKGN